MLHLKGIYVALVTPFDQHGRVAPDRPRAAAARQPPSRKDREARSFHRGLGR